MELRWYYRVLRRAWWLLLAAALAGAVVALLLSLNARPSYQAQASVLLFKSKAVLSFDPRFLTVSEDSQVGLFAQENRRLTMVALATSPAVFSRTLELLPAGDREHWSADALQGRSDIAIRGYLVDLSVEADEAGEAARVATAWAQAFTDVANQLFDAPGAASGNLDAELAATRAEYDQAESGLVAFTATSPIDDLELALLTRQQALAGVDSSYLAAARSQLDVLLTARQRLPLVLGDARALRRQLDQEPASDPALAADQATILLLQAGSFGAGASFPPTTTVQLVLPVASQPAATVGDVTRALDRLIAVLEARQARLDVEIAAQTGALLAAPALAPAQAEAVAALHAEVDRLAAELEQQKANRQALEATRDEAWERYLALQRKAGELAIAGAGLESEVVMIAPATAPASASQPPAVLNALAGALLALAAAVVIVVLQAHLSEPAPAAAVALTRDAHGDALEAPVAQR
jgi:uncharacterized protein involved in exopolysaccharide biosynthesis